MSNVCVEVCSQYRLHTKKDEPSVAPRRSEWRPTNGADEGTGAFVGEFGGSGFRVLHTGCGQGWLIRRLLEVRTLFILVCLPRRLRSLSYPCTVQSSLFRLLFRSWQCSLPGGFPCRWNILSSKLPSFRRHIL